MNRYNGMVCNLLPEVDRYELVRASLLDDDDERLKRIDALQKELKAKYPGMYLSAEEAEAMSKVYALRRAERAKNDAAAKAAEMAKQFEEAVAA